MQNKINKLKISRRDALLRVRNASQNGFTLLELLVVMAIIAILASLLLPAIQKTFVRAKATREMAAGKSLIAATMSYASDHEGQLLPGFKNDTAYDEQGRALSYPVNARYPWRLAPYLNYAMDGTLLVNDQEKVLQKADYEYAVSVGPSLGMNVFFVGGDYSGVSGSGILPQESHYARYGEFCVTRLSQASQPGKLLAFVSARYNDTQGNINGFYKVEAPNLTAAKWNTAAYSENAPAAQYGYVHLRYNNKAVAVSLDGHAELLNEDELRDMRRWSNQAAQEDDAEWKLTVR